MAMQGEIKRNVASLVGGVVIAIGVGVLGYLVLGTFGASGIGAGIAAAAIGIAAGGYVRLADL
jgi:hypothetical protein